MRALKIALILTILCPDGAKAIGTNDSIMALEILKKVAESYAENNAFQLQQTVKYYTDHQSTVAKESQPMIIKRSGENFYKLFMGLEEMRDSRNYISVYEKREMLTLDEAADRPMTELMGISFDLHAMGMKSIALETQSGKALISVFVHDALIDHVVYTVNLTNYLLEKQVVYYSSIFLNSAYQLTSFPRIETELVSFSNESTSSLADFFSSAVFLPSHYSEKSLGNRFRNYLIINLLNQKS